MLAMSSIFVLRRKRPDLPRPFRVPAIWLVAPAGIVTSVFLMLSLPLDTWLRFGIWLVIGLLLYGFYGTRHARSALQPST